MYNFSIDINIISRNKKTVANFIVTFHKKLIQIIDGQQAYCNVMTKIKENCAIIQFILLNTYFY